MIARVQAAPLDPVKNISAEERSADEVGRR